MKLNFDERISLNERAFKQYVYNTFDMNVSQINKTYLHSISCSEFAKGLAKKLKLNSYICHILALIHDIGKFNLWTNYNTYKLNENFNYHKYNIELLFEKNFIRMFSVLEEDFDFLENVLKLHSKQNREELEKNSKVLEYCKVLKDCEKLDLISLVIKGEKVIYQTKHKFTKNTQLLIKEFTELDIENLSNELLNVLNLLGLIFDLNYKQSFEFFSKEDFTNSLLNSYSKDLSIEDKSILKTIMQQVLKLKF